MLQLWYMRWYVHMLPWGMVSEWGQFSWKTNNLHWLRIHRNMLVNGDDLFWDLSGSMMYLLTFTQSTTCVVLGSTPVTYFHRMNFQGHDSRKGEHTVAPLTSHNFYNSQNVNAFSLSLPHESDAFWTLCLPQSRCHVYLPHTKRLMGIEVMMISYIEDNERFLGFFWENGVLYIKKCAIHVILWVCVFHNLCLAHFLCNLILVCYQN
jgi:hypothetical protein